MLIKKTPKQIQNVKFSSLDEFFEFIPEDELKIVEVLRKIVLDCIPDCDECLSYNVPFYRRHKGICFIWPASIKWGAKSTFTGVRFGFNQGYLLQDEINYLDKDNRKQVFWKVFTDIKEIDPEILRAYLFEAMIVDEQSKSNKNASAKNLK